MKTSGNTILITGGAGGIGLEMTKQLTALGNTVIITGRSMGKLEAVQKELPSVHAYACDVTSPEGVAALFAQVTSDFPDLNVLINNAGIMRPITFLDADPSHICDEIDTNLSGPIRMVQTFLPHLLKQEEAAIVNVTSGLAYINYDEAPIYGASKAGLHAYTKSLRSQLEGTGVKVFALAPPKTSKPLISRDDPNAGNNKVPTMDIPDVVAALVKDMAADRFEINPGLSRALKLAGRFQL